MFINKIYSHTLDKSINYACKTSIILRYFFVIFDDWLFYDAFKKSKNI
ncbi:hypothetical protein Thert_02776 [Thermoanaerobacterium thermosaccharolyticum]|uniref:Uncharacterized protein n=1 Tax=Thermoanaerobacterium thermosaccharolyticum TaxID=1517 RepID=A0A223I263_THETR|nr:hypothetical protein Thert_02776 [Thermoanaerobacterium thermosaccharolyticum]